jgi:glycosyltransferase involved in cell wall biosynthesis
MPEVLHVLTTLDVGGAQVALLKLLQRIDRDEFPGRVVSLTQADAMAPQLAELGVPVHGLGMQRGVPDPRAVVRLSRLIRRVRPDVIQTWMYHSDLLGGLAARIVRGPPVAWGIRQSDLDPAASPRLTRLVAGACASLSRRVPASIVCCSEASLRVHAGLGYAAERMIVIRTGFDLDRFRPNPHARQAFRTELGIGDDTPVVGLVGRLDPQKDHRTFLLAAGLLLERMPCVQFVLCGKEITEDSSDLVTWASEAGARDSVHLLGPRSDMPQVNAGLDVASSSSAYGEGLSNAIGEAMATGVPCVVTDVGDSADLVGRTGRSVPPRDPYALARAWEELLRLPRGERSELGALARRRVAEVANLDVMVRRFAELWSGLAASGRSRQRTRLECLTFNRRTSCRSSVGRRT